MTDADALRWQKDREQVVGALDFLDRLLEMRRQEGKPPLPDQQVADWLRNRLLGGEGCVIAPFDHRLPGWLEALSPVAEDAF